MSSSNVSHQLETRRGDPVGYDLRGEPGSGPALVFVAGAGPYRATDSITGPTAERVSQSGVATVVWDRLGRGESTARGRLDLDRELDAVAAVVEASGGSAVLCGHSSGCAIALRAAAAGLPVVGLVLFEAPLGKGADATAAWYAEVERRMDSGDLEGAQEHYMVDMPPEWLATAKASPAWPAITAGVVSLRADGQALTWAERALADGSLADIDVPVLAVYGAETFPGMPEAAAAIAAAVPSGSVAVVPGAQHRWDVEPMAAELVSFTQQAGLLPGAATRVRG